MVLWVELDLGSIFVKMVWIQLGQTMPLCEMLLFVTVIVIIDIIYWPSAS